MKYIYKNHLDGNLYTSTEKLSYARRYCEQCGDSDECIGMADCRTDAWIDLEDIIERNGSGGYDFDYIKNFIETEWSE